MAPAAELKQNPPYKRFAYVAKQYGGKHPEAVLDTFLVLADTVGIERPEGDFEWAYTYVNAGVTADDKLAAELLPEALRDLKTDPRMKRGRESDALWPWVARELVKAKKRDRYAYLRLLNAFMGKGSAIALWQRQNRVDLGQWPAEKLLHEIEDFDVDADEVPQGKLLHRWPDGWTMQQLVSEEQLESEGEIMQHCVGNYCHTLHEGNVDILSLRDPSGKPHATIEHNTAINRFLQVQGKQNEPPKNEYRSRVDEYAALKGILPQGLTSEELQKLRNHGDNLGRDYWEHSKQRHGFSIVDSETPNVEFDIEEAAENLPGDAQDWMDADMEDEIEDAVMEAANDAWEAEYQEAMQSLDELADDIAERAGEEEDPDIEYMIQAAFDSAPFDWGHRDVDYVTEEVESRGL